MVSKKQSLAQIITLLPGPNLAQTINAEGSRNPWVIKFHGRLGC